MGENIWDSDDDDFDAEENAAKNQDAPKGLRAHAKKLERENAEFRRKIEEFEAANRKATLADAIKAKGLNPKISALVPTDIATEQLDKWLDDYGDVFGKAEASAPASQPSAEDEEEYGDYRRISQAAARGETPGKGSDLYSELTDKNLTQSRLLELIEAAGGGYGT